MYSEQHTVLTAVLSGITGIFLDHSGSSNVVSLFFFSDHNIKLQGMKGSASL